MSFAAIPVRSNGQGVDATWWNLLRTAGVALEALIGGSAMKYITSAMSPYTVDPAADFDLIADMSTGAITINTCPVAANANYAFRVKRLVLGDVPANALLVNSVGDGIDNTAFISMPNKGEAHEFKTDGGTWHVY